MHLAVLSSDIETVLALLSVSVNVNSRVQDSQGKTGLHLACETGNEMIVRNLVRNSFFFFYFYFAICFLVVVVVVVVKVELCLLILFVVVGRFECE